MLCLHGAESDLVLKDATDEMLRRGPGTLGLARVVDIAGCGHAPALNVPDQLDLVASFLEQNDGDEAAVAVTAAATALHP